MRSARYVSSIARAVSVAALLCVFGISTFRVFVAARVVGRMPAAEDPFERRLCRATRVAAAGGVAGLMAWLVVQTGDMAGAEPAVRAIPAVLWGTRFGHLVAWQAAALLGVAASACMSRGRVALGFAAVALGLQAGHGHAASMQDGPRLLLASDLVHLLAAGAWLGGLVPLLLVVRDAPAKVAASAARWFSPMGKLCIVALVGSALFQGWVLVGSLPGLVGTAYGWMALVKLALFGVLFAFAAVNRYRLAPALLGRDPTAARRALVRSIAVQTGFGLAITAAASVLGGLPPAMHEQPVWPFAHRFSLETVGEDPELRNEALAAASALAAAAILAGIAAAARRRLGNPARWAALGCAGVMAWLAIPHLDLLFVPAFPTSFYNAPTSFAATSILRGAALFPGHCAACHGADGRGGGPAAKGLPVPPADLTAAHLWMHSDGELFWWLSHGIEAPEGGLAMPGFAGVLPDGDRWALIDYIRAYNAGLTVQEAGSWSPPVQAPGLQARCMDGATMSLEGFRGGFVRLVIGATPASAMPGVTTVVTQGGGASPSPGLCVSDDESVPRAYGIVAGVQLRDLPGTEFLIDADGWLRAVEAPGDPSGWSDPARLAATIRQLAAHPLAAGGGHGHGQM